MKTRLIEVVVSVATVLALSSLAYAGERGRGAGGAGGGLGGGRDRTKSERPDRSDSGRRKGLSATQQQNVQQLQTDMASIKAGSQVTQAQKDALSASLKNMADGAKKPSQQSVDQLSGDLSKALSDGKLSAKEQAQLSQDIGVVMNSANISQEEAQQAAAAATDILKASGVGKDDIQRIQADLNAIASTAQASAPAK